MNSSDLIAEIESSFENEVYPGDLSLVNDNSGFDLEAAGIRDAFKGKKWQDVPDSLLFEERTSLGFMSKEGFKYYLPAFMRFAVKDFEGADDGVDMVVRLLTLPTEIDVAVMAEGVRRYELAGKLPDVDFNEILQNQLQQTNAGVNSFVARAAQFSATQGRTIYHFLAYLRDEHGDEFARNEPELAIQRYWFQFA